MYDVIESLQRKYNFTFCSGIIANIILHSVQEWGGTGEWRKLHNEKLNDLYSSQSIIRIIKARRMRWAWHVDEWGRGETRIGCWWESQRKGGH
jgi:hypothetical protein